MTHHWPRRLFFFLFLVFADQNSAFIRSSFLGGGFCVSTSAFDFASTGFGLLRTCYLPHFGFFILIDFPCENIIFKKVITRGLFFFNFF